MLVAGVVLGVLLGPAVLGRLSAEYYDTLFVGSGDTTHMDQARDALTQFVSDADTRQALIDQIIAKYQIVGGEDDSTAIARDEQLMQLNNRFAQEQDRLEQNLVAASSEVALYRETHLDKLLGMATAMLILAVMLFAAEAILSPQREEIEQGRAALPPILSRLVTVRYALLAGWLMLMLAQPVWLRGIDLTFGLVLLLVVLVAGLVPLGKTSNKKAPDT